MEFWASLVSGRILVDSSLPIFAGIDDPPIRVALIFIVALFVLATCYLLRQQFD